MVYESSARQALAELAYGKTLEEYIALVWAQRYPSPNPPSSNGWPVRRKIFKLTRIK